MKKVNGEYMMSESMPTLTRRNLKRAKRVMYMLIDFMEKEGIEYHLEGGTLLGIVRDHRLLPWDYDIDLSIMEKDAEKFAEKSKKFWWRGYRVKMKKMHKDIGPLKKGQYRVFKIKKIIPHLFKELFSKAEKYTIVADVFVKASDDKHTYWQAMERILRCDQIYYTSHEIVDFEGRKLRAPYKYEDYLTEKYGDWLIPKKEWVCANDEKTIVDKAYTD